MALMKEYDPDQIVVTLAGILAEGYADGEFVMVEEASPRFTKKVGTDGTVTRSKNMDRSAKITIKLMQSSATNDLFSALALQDQNNPNGAGVGVCEIKDLQGTSLHSAAEAWISEVPKASYDKEAGPREWVIECAFLVSNHGGN